MKKELKYVFWFILLADSAIRHDITAGVILLGVYIYGNKDND